MDGTNARNITILGAGIMGLMNAYTLAKSGHQITFVDPNGFPNTTSASFIAGGMLAPYSEIEHMNLDWVEAGNQSINVWKTLPLETGFTQNGSLLIACAHDLHILQRFQNHIPTNIQNNHPPQDIEPDLDKKFRTGLYLKTEAHLNSEKTMHALIAHLKSQPNVTLTTTPPTSNTQHPTSTIDCTGMAANDPHIRGIKGETLIVHNPEFNLKRPVRLMHPRYPLYIIPRQNAHGDNIFMIGATTIESDKNNTVSLRSAMELMSALHTLSPTFSNAQVIDIKAGIRPAYPDNLPRITINENTITANGLFRHGYLLAPIMAQCISDHLNNVQNKHMKLFRKNQNENHTQWAA